MVVALREAVGRTVVLRADANRKWSLNQAVAFGHAVSSCAYCAEHPGVVIITVLCSTSRRVFENDSTVPSLSTQSTRLFTCAKALATVPYPEPVQWWRLLLSCHVLGCIVCNSWLYFFAAILGQKTFVITSVLMSYVFGNQWWSECMSLGCNLVLKCWYVLELKTRLRPCVIK